MGGGSWTEKSFRTYSTAKGMSVSSTGEVVGLDCVQDNFKSRSIAPELSPMNIMRECCDTDEHPNTIPVIIGLDVTGSMGQAAVEVAKSLNVIMKNILSKMTDVEFCVMGIGDLAYDNAPIQMSQFESDIRIAEHMDKVYFEFGGGGNIYESYTAAWYMGARHTKLDCWERGKKGIIITLGDETLNPYLPKEPLMLATGDGIQDDIQTSDLIKEVSEKYDIYHIYVKHGSYWQEESRESFLKYLPEDHYFETGINGIPDVITKIITSPRGNSSEGISW